MNELFFHECRAAGLVFKTSDDWFKWLTDNHYDIKKPVAEHEGFKYNINDVCTNPHVIEYSVEDADNWGWKVMTAKTQFGWIWGYSIQKGKDGYDDIWLADDEIKALECIIKDYNADPNNFKRR